MRCKYETDYDKENGILERITDGICIVVLLLIIFGTILYLIQISDNLKNGVLVFLLEIVVVLSILILIRIIRNI